MYIYMMKTDAKLMNDWKSTCMFVKKGTLTTPYTSIVVY